MFDRKPQQLVDPQLPFAIEIVRSARRTKTISFEVHRTKVIARVPIAVTISELQRIVDGRKHVLIDKWNKVQSVRPIQEARSSARSDAQTLPDRVLLQGEAYPIVHQHTFNKSRFSLRYLDKQLVITSPHDVRTDVDFVSTVNQLVASWLRKVARRHLVNRLEHWSTVMHLTYQDFRLKDQKTRWGSCSSLGNINLNWRLIQAPDWVTDYVVIHELAHLEQLNHSPAFWAIVAKYHPSYKDAKNWLTVHGEELQGWR